MNGDSCWGNILLRGRHPFDGGRGGTECESLEGEEQEERGVKDEEDVRCRFLIEKLCSAREKWVGRGNLAAEVSTVTDIVSGVTGRPPCTMNFRNNTPNVALTAVVYQQKNATVSITGKKKINFTAKMNRSGDESNESETQTNLKNSVPPD